MILLWIIGIALLVGAIGGGVLVWWFLQDDIRCNKFIDEFDPGPRF